MATVEEVRQELNDAKDQRTKAERALQEFKEDENEGKWLDELRTKQRKGTISKREEKRLDALEVEKNNWRIGRKSV